MKGVTVNITLSRTLYIDVPDDISDKDFLKKIESEVILPHNALTMANNALRSVNINIPNLDISDWDTKNVEYNILNSDE